MNTTLKILGTGGLVTNGTFFIYKNGIALTSTVFQIFADTHVSFKTIITVVANDVLDIRLLIDRNITIDMTKAVWWFLRLLPDPRTVRQI